MFQTTTIPPMTAREVLVAAEERLRPMIARRGIDDEVLAVAGTYERMYRNAIGAPAPVDDTFALAESVRERSSSVAGLASLRAGSAVAR